MPAEDHAQGWPRRYGRDRALGQCSASQERIPRSIGFRDEASKVIRAGDTTNCVGHAAAQFGEGVAGVDAGQTQHGGSIERNRRMDGVWPLLLFTAIATATPGGATVVAVASGARFGVARSLPLVVGMAIGLGLMAAAAGSGLGALLLLAPSLQTGLRVVGTAYLLWLAWRIARTGAPGRGETAAPAGIVLGLIFNVQNPKAWAITLGAAASFSCLAASPAGLALLLGATFGSFALLALSAWCVAGGEMGRRLRTERQGAVMNTVLGALLAGSVIPIWLP